MWIGNAANGRSGWSLDTEGNYIPLFLLLVTSNISNQSFSLFIDAAVRNWIICEK